VLVVPARLGIHSVAGFLDALKRDRQAARLRLDRAGSLSHLTMEANRAARRATMVHIPYGGSPQAMTAVIRGTCRRACLPAIAVTPQARRRRREDPGVATARRCASCPRCRREESGIDVESDAWNALIAPAGTPGRRHRPDQRRGARTLTKPSVRERLEAQMMEPTPSSAAGARQTDGGGNRLWREVIRSGDIRSTDRTNKEDAHERVVQTQPRHPDRRAAQGRVRLCHQPAVMAEWIKASHRIDSEDRPLTRARPSTRHAHPLGRGADELGGRGCDSPKLRIVPAETAVKGPIVIQYTCEAVDGGTRFTRTTRNPARPKPPTDDQLARMDAEAATALGNIKANVERRVKG